ncbi:unnamed protein product [Lasius platythorax]|uniref:Uncharacterized protein n=2 Tax=Lasius TaxID=488720 RepID=A0A0J7L171_LASNI|nr:hypothetical protein RF55_3501 [Lasius niger]
MAGHSSVIETRTFLRITRTSGVEDRFPIARLWDPASLTSPSTSVPGPVYGLNADGDKTTDARSPIKRNAGSERDRERLGPIRKSGKWTKRVWG